jgi:hypothetical protein
MLIAILLTPSPPPFAIPDKRGGVPIPGMGNYALDGQDLTC